MKLHRNLACTMVIAALSVASAANAQEEKKDDQSAAFPRLLQRFDKDGDGKLSASERAALREFLAGGRDVQDDAPAKPTVDPNKTDLYKLANGPLEIEAVEKLVLQDEKQNKPLQLRVTFPKPAGSYPVIVFSHGASGSKDGYQPLITYWTSHGYVCIQPTHGDSLSLLSAEERQRFQSLNDYVNSSAALQHWQSRPEDIRFVLDSLDKIEAEIPNLKGKLDKTRIGMGGHSFGAHTTQMIGGLTLKNPVTAQRTSYTDLRPSALLMISPQGTGGGVDKDSWNAIDRPAMVVTGTNDTSRTGQPYTWRMEVYDNLPPGDKYLAFVEGAQHSFGGIAGVRYPGSGAENQDHVYYVKSASLAFWDTHLKSDKAAADFLASDKLKEVTRGAAYLRRKSAE
jgi:dienelactone hydrolase